jgi:hypothetical protein
VLLLLFEDSTGIDEMLSSCSELVKIEGMVLKESMSDEDNNLRTAHGPNMVDMRQRATPSVSKSRTKGLVDEKTRLSFWS